MANVRTWIVTATGKNDDGDIVSLCNYDPRWATWHAARLAVVKAIDGTLDEYYVIRPEPNVPTAKLRVVYRYGQPYLTTHPDDSTRNNLDNLPDCLG